jgi:AraC-like DNA-binding protein
MILERKHFDIYNKCAIEKFVIKTPLKYGAFLQDEACFIYVKEGEVSYASPTDTLMIQTSESVLLKCGNYLANFVKKSNSETCEVYAVHLYAEILKELYKNEFPQISQHAENKPYIKILQQSSIISHFIQSLDFYFSNPALVTEELLKLKLKELIILLLQTDNAENIITLFSHLFNPRHASLVEVVQAHVYSSISVEELADLAGRSLSTFKRDFQVQYDDSPANYMKQKKLEKSLELVLSTELSISEICYEVGFQDTSHFTKAFKQKFKKSPTDYRKSI